MSRKKAVTTYRVTVKPSGTSAKIVAFKEHIGRMAEVRILPKEEEQDANARRD